LARAAWGEVYRARDTKLRRDVAIKVLPEAVRLDPERLTRFEREALVLASLNHPNIASIYGVEETSGIVALILELIEGGTLSARIARGPISVGEALTIARQIAEGLETAHEKGVVHRDLKPANITITPTGLVKVLDFGLAKVAATADVPNNETQAVGVTEGMVIGTAAYMSPEQARGQAVDRRTDIWAFGCVLYEMLTGQRLFDGKTTTDTLSLVLTKDPDWSALPPQVPSAIRALLRRCLERDRQKRLGDVAAIRFALEDVAGPSAVDQQTAGSTPRDEPGSRTTRRWLATLVVTALVVGSGAWYLARFLPSRTPTSANVTHLTFVPEGPLPVDGRGHRPLAGRPPCCVCGPARRTSAAVPAGIGCVRRQSDSRHRGRDRRHILSGRKLARLRGRREDSKDRGCGRRIRGTGRFRRGQGDVLDPELGIERLDPVQQRTEHGYLAHPRGRRSADKRDDAWCRGNRAARPADPARWKDSSFQREEVYVQQCAARRAVARDWSATRHNRRH
jgi:serine/threonine protein kinase